jgi:hypothetical protein
MQVKMVYTPMIHLTRASPGCRLSRLVVENQMGSDLRESML